MAMPPAKNWAEAPVPWWTKVHLFAPQQGKTDELGTDWAELAARGRKPGILPRFLPHQRFSRTAKDCTSQCHNLYVALNTKAGEIDRANG